MHMHKSRVKWQHGPPQGPPPDWSGENWPAEWDKRRRFFMRRFIGCFLFAVLSFAAILAGLIILALNAFRGQTVGSGEVIILISCLGVVVLAVVLFVGGLAFRGIGSPLADLMTAADAVAAGDLAVRVPERGRGDMARLVGRFNRMTAELERAEESRRNLTADVAHELRTPLQIIQGNLEGVLDGVYEPTADHITDMLDETRHLARLVEELQTLSLAEAGQLPLHPQTLPAADLLEDVVTRFAAAAADAGVILKALPGETLPVTVDPDRMEQVLSNLVANALRHTPTGGRITLSATATTGGVELTVTDSGAGIDAADLPYVFDRFWRGDRARTRGGGGGAGLGLPIARRLVETHGGTIRVESAPGEGTRFTIRLPQTSEVP